MYLHTSGEQCVKYEYPAGKGWPLGSLVYCVFWCSVTFPYSVLGQVCYMTVSISDLCLLLTLLVCNMSLHVLRPWRQYQVCITHTCKSLSCSYTQSMDLDENSDQHSARFTNPGVYIRVLRICDRYLILLLTHLYSKIALVNGIKLDKFGNNPWSDIHIFKYSILHVKEKKQERNVNIGAIHTKSH